MKCRAKLLQGNTVFQHFKIMQKIGTGAFGEIYKAENQDEGGQYLALKAEPISTRHPQVLFEARLYKYLNSEGELEGIPKIYNSGVENGYNMMLMDLLGKSLEELFVQKYKSFSLKTVILIGLQVFNRIQYLHSKHFIHRDIKPDNLLMGTNKNSNTIFLIDMGLSKKYISKEKGHIPYKQGKELTGTARYASINTHKGFEQSRRDDIESIGYVLVYFLKGILPWQNMKATTTKAKYDMIKNKKITTQLDVICKGFPSQFASIISYARQLKFDEKPDYELLKGLLKSVANKNNLQLDGQFDWSQ